ncbi:MAG: PrgI family protein [Chloroflexi bacterium]|nr:PrgI family protein [Chloroflexota bacterium]
MPHHEVPTHLDVEDRVLFGLTVRQFLYLLVGSSAGYGLWDQLGDTPWLARVGCVGVILMTTLAFALLRLGGRPLEEWLAAGLVYLARPRTSTWQPREPLDAEWRPVGTRWQELSPSLTWADEMVDRLDEEP